MAQPIREPHVTSKPEWPVDCPRPPADEADLPFERQPMVDWLAPKELASTGVRAAMAAVFGAYADKREVQAALNPIDPGGDPAALYEDYSRSVGPGETFWVDYAADTGDGFDATYGVAWALSRRHLDVEGMGAPLPRGHLLVLGGDQVYPTSNREEYQNRFTGPLRAAFPWGPADEAPDLYAIPGNHDWYDGLTSFTRLFCQGRWVGGWTTRQKRSYFALKLPHGWWLWGTDIQLSADVDLPQRRYFEQVAQVMRQQAEEAGGGSPKLILCTAQPQWVYCDVDPPGERQPPRRGCRLRVDPEEFNTLEYFHREVIAANGIELAAMFSGDLHHYTRYEKAESAPQSPSTPSQLVTAGGAGAYLYPTHHMPEGLQLPYSHRPKGGQLETVPVRYARRAVYPKDDDSRALGRWSWVKLPWRNRGFAVMLALIYVLFAWMVQSASKAGNDLFEWWDEYAAGEGLRTYAEVGEPWLRPSLMELLSELHPGHFPKVLHTFWDVLRHSPSSVVLVLAVVFGLFAFRRSAGSNVAGGVAGLVHGVAHLLLACWLVWAFSWINLRFLGFHVDHPGQVLLFFAQMLVAGGLLGGWLFGLYLMVTSKVSGAHMNEVFSSQSIPHRKNFLRLEVGPRQLKVYPVGIPQVPEGKGWRYRGADPALAPGDAWYDPPDGRIASELIEPPFEVR